MEIVYELVQIFVCVFEVYLMFDFFSSFFSLKESLKSKYAKVGIVSGLSVCVYFVNRIGSSGVNVFFMQVFYLMLVFLAFSGDVLKKLLHYIIASMIMLSSEFLFLLILSDASQFSFDVMQYNSFSFIVILLGIKLLTYLLFSIFKRVSPNTRDRKIDIKHFFLQTIIPVSWFGIIIATAYLNVEFNASESVQILLIVSCILGIVGNVLIFYAFNRYFLSVEKIQQQNIMITKLEMEERYYEQMDNVNQKHAKMLHDIHHYLTTIGEMASQNRDEDILEILSELQIRVADREKIDYCENKLLNAILNEKRKSAQSIEIDLKIKVENGFFINQVKEIDLIGIIGNLVDNAIEASAKCEKGYVKVFMFMQNQNNYSVIKVLNNYKGQIILEDEKLVTTKKDKKRHGIGIQSVVDTLERYNGSLQNFYENNVFTTIVLIPVNNSKIQKF